MKPNLVKNIISILSAWENESIHDPARMREIKSKIKEIEETTDLRKDYAFVLVDLLTDILEIVRGNYKTQPID